MPTVTPTNITALDPDNSTENSSVWSNSSLYENATENATALLRDFVADYVQSASVRSGLASVFSLCLLLSLCLYLINIVVIWRSDTLPRRPVYLVFLSLFVAEIVHAVLVIPLEAVAYSRDNELDSQTCSAQAVLRMWTLSNIFCSSGTVAIFLLVDFCRPNWHLPCTGRFYVILGAVLLAWGVPVFPALSATTPAHFSHDVLACAIPRVEEFVLSLLLYFPVTVIVLGAYVFRTAYERRFHPYPTPKVKHVDLALFVMHDSNHRAFLMLICHHVLLIISYTLPSVLQRAFLEDEDSIRSVAVFGSVLYGIRSTLAAIIIVVVNSDLRAALRNFISRRTGKVDSESEGDSEIKSAKSLRNDDASSSARLPTGLKDGDGAALPTASKDGAGDAPKNAKSDAVPNSGDLLGREKSPGVPQFAGPPREAQAPTETQL